MDGKTGSVLVVVQQDIGNGHDTPRAWKMAGVHVDAAGLIRGDVWDFKRIAGGEDDVDCVLRHGFDMGVIDAIGGKGDIVLIGQGLAFDIEIKDIVAIKREDADEFMPVINEAAGAGEHEIVAAKDEFHGASILILYRHCTVLIRAIQCFRRDGSHGQAV